MVCRVIPIDTNYYISTLIIIIIIRDDLKNSVGGYVWCTRLKCPTRISSHWRIVGYSVSIYYRMTFILWEWTHSIHIIPKRYWHIPPFPRVSHSIQNRLTFHSKVAVEMFQMSCSREIGNDRHFRFLYRGWSTNGTEHRDVNWQIRTESSWLSRSIQDAVKSAGWTFCT